MADIPNTPPHLAQVVAAFQAEFPARLLEASDDMPEAQLLVELPVDQADRPRYLELTFLPHDDGVYFLQFFVALPYQLLPERMGDLARLIARINAAAPLIGFGLSEELSLSFFRCVVPCPSQALDSEILINTAYVALYMIDQLGEVLESLATGSASLAACEARLKQESMAESAA